jgi:hypothetical protein
MSGIFGDNNEDKCKENKLLNSDISEGCFSSLVESFPIYLDDKIIEIDVRVNVVCSEYDDFFELDIIKAVLIDDDFMEQVYEVTEDFEKYVVDHYENDLKYEAGRGI